MHTLHFTKIFTTGSLAGLTVNDCVSFPTAHQCEQAVENYQRLADRNRWYVGGYFITEDGQPGPLHAGIDEAKASIKSSLEASGYDEGEILIVMSVVGSLAAFVQRAAWDQQMSERDRANALTQMRTAVHSKLGLKALERKNQDHISNFWEQLSLVEHFAHLVESTVQLGKVEQDGQPMWLTKYGTVPAINADLNWLH